MHPPFYCFLGLDCLGFLSAQGHASTLLSDRIQLSPLHLFLAQFHDSN